MNESRNLDKSLALLLHAAELAKDMRPGAVLRNWHNQALINRAVRKSNDYIRRHQEIFANDIGPVEYAPIPGR